MSASCSGPELPDHLRVAASGVGEGEVSAPDDRRSASRARGGPGCASARPSRRTSRAAFFEENFDPLDPLLGFAPYEHVAPRRNSITPERQRAFIAALAATGIVTQAARSVGASLEALYRLRNKPGAEGFASAWELAIDRGMARLEDCALERAILGEERPVVRDGEVVATWRRHDTALLMFLLRQRRGSRFGTDADPAPGSALFEKVRAKIEAMREPPEVILARINARIDRLRIPYEAEPWPEDLESEDLESENLETEDPGD